MDWPPVWGAQVGGQGSVGRSWLSGCKASPDTGLSLPSPPRVPASGFLGGGPLRPAPFSHPRLPSASPFHDSVVVFFSPVTCILQFMPLQKLLDCHSSWHFRGSKRKHLCSVHGLPWASLAPLGGRPDHALPGLFRHPAAGVSLSPPP